MYLDFVRGSVNMGKMVHKMEYQARAQTEYGDKRRKHPGWLYIKFCLVCTVFLLCDTYSFVVSL